MVVWFAFANLKKVESKVWRINLVSILRRLQLKAHIREEAERISSLLEQEEAVVSTRDISKEIEGFFQVNSRGGLKIIEVIFAYEGSFAERNEPENWQKKTTLW